MIMALSRAKWVSRGAEPSGVDTGGVQLGCPAHKEVAPRRYLTAHEQIEHGRGGGGVLDPDPAQGPVTRVHGGLRELARVHLTQALVPLQGLLPALALALELEQRSAQLPVGVGVGVPVLA